MSNEQVGKITAIVMKDKSVVVEMEGHLTGALLRGHVLQAIYKCYARNYKRELFREAEKFRAKMEEEMKKLDAKASVEGEGK